jgi:hypothetical protein
MGLIVIRGHLAISRIQNHNFVVIGSDCTDSCKSNYYTITTMTAPLIVRLVAK